MEKDFVIIEKENVSKKDYVKADLTMVKEFDGDVLLFSGDVGEAIRGQEHNLED